MKQKRILETLGFKSFVEMKEGNKTFSKSRHTEGFGFVDEYMDDDLGGEIMFILSDRDVTLGSVMSEKNISFMPKTRIKPSEKGKSGCNFIKDIVNRLSVLPLNVSPNMIHLKR